MFFLKFFKKISFAQIIYGCAWVLVMGLFSTTAQAKCSVSLANVNNIPLKTFVARTPGTPAAPLFKQTLTATYTNCDAPINDLTFTLLTPLSITKNSVALSPTGSPAAFLGFQSSCLQDRNPNVRCLTSNNSIISTNDVTGISFLYEANIVSACGKGNVTSTPTSTTLGFLLSTNGTVCSSFQVVVTLTIFRGSDVITAGTNFNKVRLKMISGDTFQVNVSSLDNSLVFAGAALINVFNQDITYAEGTCALGFNPSSVNLGNFQLNAVQSTPVDTRIPNSSKNVTITISNCTGFAVGSTKVFLVQFNKPRATDSTLMDNELSSAAGGNTGVSARITADSRLDASTKAALSPVVKSGEFFITSAGTSDSKNMTYTVEFVRNSDTATTGAFSSSAVFTMSYQ